MRIGLVAVSIVMGALVLGGCTSSPAPRQSAAGSPATPPATTADAAPTTTPPPRPEETLVELAESELATDVIPDGFTFINAVDMDASGAVSHVYGGPSGPDGPTLFIHTGLTSAESNEAMTGLEQERVPELSGTFPVTIARDPDPWSWTFVTIDASPAGVVRVIGNAVPDDDVLEVVDRLITTAEAA